MKIKQKTDNDWVYFKRFIEILNSNTEYKNEFLDAPQKWLDNHSIPLEVSSVYDYVKNNSSNEYTDKMYNMVEDIHKYHRQITDTERIRNLNFKNWYKRQIAGYKFQSKIARHMPGIFFAPITFELSEGCSVGCSFCCLEADKLKGIFKYTEDNREKWRSILKSSKELLGEITNFSICYFATEPLDNPDYERFIQDFYDVYGGYPQTTTAVSHRNIKRTKMLLEQVGEENLKRAAVRFSITSLEQLEKIHREFTPEELAYVELLLNNKESLNKYSKSGRSIELSKVLDSEMFIDELSCICTCGFVVNMYSNTIKLVVPTRPSDMYPKGMKVLDEANFNNEYDFASTIEQMIYDNMKNDININAMYKLDEYIDYTIDENAIIFRGDKVSRKIVLSNKECLYMKDLLDNNMSLYEIKNKISVLEKKECDRFISIVRGLYHLGYIYDV